MQQPLTSFSRCVSPMKLSALLIVSGVAAVAVAATEPSHKIAGGHEAAQGQFPWLVTLELTNSEATWHLCGGVLIASQWVLTAAHCLDSEKPEWLAVMSGEHRKDVLEGTEQLHLVDYFIQHPSYIYYEKPYVNDVALVHLTRPVTCDAYTQIAELRRDYLPLTAGSCTEAGWGEVTGGEGMSNTLMYVDVPLRPTSDCEAAYSSPHDPNTICAGSLYGGVGFCVGDNGGGLMCWDAMSERYLVSGILSWRDGCAQPGKPGVYMDVAPYMDWIVSVVNHSSMHAENHTSA